MNRQEQAISEQIRWFINSDASDCHLSKAAYQVIYDRLQKLDQIEQIVCEGNTTLTVVRCKECAYSKNGQCTKGENYYPEEDLDYNPEYNPDWFCADGVLPEVN